MRQSCCKSPIDSCACSLPGHHHLLVVTVSMVSEQRPSGMEVAIDLSFSIGQLEMDPRLQLSYSARSSQFPCLYSHRSRITPWEDATAFGVTWNTLGFDGYIGLLVNCILSQLGHVLVWSLFMVNNFFASLAVREI